MSYMLYRQGREGICRMERISTTAPKSIAIKYNGYKSVHEC